MAAPIEEVKKEKEQEKGQEKKEKGQEKGQEKENEKEKEKEKGQEKEKGREKGQEKGQEKEQEKEQELSGKLYLMNFSHLSCWKGSEPGWPCWEEQPGVGEAQPGPVGTSRVAPVTLWGAVLGQGRVFSSSLCFWGSLQKATSMQSGAMTAHRT